MLKLKLNHTIVPDSDRVMEFHISKSSRKKYNFDNNLFSITGNVVIANTYNARLFAERMNSVSKKGVRASDVFAMGLMDEILHFVIAEHRKKVAPNLFKDIITSVSEQIGESELNKTLLLFIKEFPVV